MVGIDGSWYNFAALYFVLMLCLFVCLYIKSGRFYMNSLSTFQRNHFGGFLMITFCHNKLFDSSCGDFLLSHSSTSVLIL